MYNILVVSDAETLLLNNKIRRYKQQQKMYIYIPNRGVVLFALTDHL
jgi:hypothetical protein